MVKSDNCFTEPQWNCLLSFALIQMAALGSRSALLKSTFFNTQIQAFAACADDNLAAFERLDSITQSERLRLQKAALPSPFPTISPNGQLVANSNVYIPSLEFERALNDWHHCGFLLFGWYVYFLVIGGNKEGVQIVQQQDNWKMQLNKRIWVTLPPTLANDIQMLNLLLAGQTIDAPWLRLPPDICLQAAFDSLSACCFALYEQPAKPAKSQLLHLKDGDATAPYCWFDFSTARIRSKQYDFYHFTKYLVDEERRQLATAFLSL